MKLDDTRIAVFMLATRTGNSNGSGGHGSFCTTRMKKYAVKNDPNSIASEMMKSRTPSSCGVDARALVRLGRPVMLVGVRARSD